VLASHIIEKSLISTRPVRLRGVFLPDRYLRTHEGMTLAKDLKIDQAKKGRLLQIKKAFTKAI